MVATPRPLDLSDYGYAPPTIFMGEACHKKVQRALGLKHSSIHLHYKFYIFQMRDYFVRLCSFGQSE